MDKINLVFRQKTKNRRGDTLVEVLIAIAVAAFAIGTSYSIANRSLQRAITARERNEALNLAESQISALKIRFKTDIKAFRSDDVSTGFVVNSTASPSSFPYTDYHFCLDEQSLGTKDTAHPWARQQNNFTNDVQPETLAVGNPGYKDICKRTTGTTDYYIDISAQITSSSNSATANRTVYKVMVRWPEIGSSDIGRSIIYYRL